MNTSHAELMKFLAIRKQYYYYRVARHSNWVRGDNYLVTIQTTSQSNMHPKLSKKKKKKTYKQKKHGGRIVNLYLGLRATLISLMFFTLVRSRDGLCFDSLSSSLAKEIIATTDVSKDFKLQCLLLYDCSFGLPASSGTGAYNTELD